jgi:glutamate racemase
MSDENNQEIGVNVYDEDELIEDEEAAAPQPVEVVREEIMTVTKNPNTEEKVSVMGNTEDNYMEADLRELLKSHSDQISRLTDMVESLQSQIKQINQRRVSGNKTSSVRRNTSTTKTKKNKTTSKKLKGKSSRWK